MLLCIEIEAKTCNSIIDDLNKVQATTHENPSEREAVLHTKSIHNTFKNEQSVT